MDLPEYIFSSFPKFQIKILKVCEKLNPDGRFASVKGLHSPFPHPFPHTPFYFLNYSEFPWKWGEIWFVYWKPAG